MHELDIVNQAGILLCLTCRLVDVVIAVMLSRHVLPVLMSAVETGSHALSDRLYMMVKIVVALYILYSQQV